MRMARAVLRTGRLALVGGVILTGMGAGRAGAQGTAADYTRASRLEAQTRGKVTHGAVAPQWIDNGPRFWYRSDLGDGKRLFVLVEPDAKVKKRPAFDHARLAAGIAALTGKRALAPDRLPIERIVFPSKNAVQFQMETDTFEADLKTYVVRRVTGDALGRVAPLAPSNAPPSRNGGDAVSITFANQTNGPLALFWVDGDSVRHAYGALAPGETRQVGTYAGHTWLLTRPDNGASWVAFVATEKASLAVAQGDKPVAPAPPKPRDAPGLSPDRKEQVIFKGDNVVLRDRATGGETILTRDGAAGDGYGNGPYWSPDSRRFVVFKTEAAQEHKIYLVESSPRDQIQPKLHAIDYLKPGDRIAHPRPFLFDARTGKSIAIKDDLFPNPWDLNDVAWEPDGSRFTFLYNARGHQSMRLVAVDARTGTASVVIDEQAKTFIDWTNKVYLRRLPKSGEAVWMSERDGWNHLYLYDSRTGRVKNQITRGAWVVRGVDRVDEVKRQIWFRAGGVRAEQDPYYVHYCRVNFDGTGFTVLTSGDGTHQIAFSPDNRYFVDTFSRVDLPPVSVLRRASDGGAVCELEKGDASALIATGWRAPERFAAPARDGVTPIYGVICRPTNFDPDRKYPVIENIYAGPQSAFVPKAWSNLNGMQTLAELGFIVVQIDGMGTNWRSRAFHDVCWKNLADAGLPDRIAWIRAAGKTRPFMDLARVGIYGTSAGGQNALGALLLHGDFYRAGVADCGCHDNRMDKIWWNEQWMGWPVGPHYAAQSNVTLAPNLRGDLLLLVGEMDTNVDPASTYQVADALIKANKPFEYVVMPGAGHGVLGTPYGKRRLQDFFVRHLLGVAPPASGG